MVTFALNQMTVQHMPFEAFVSLAADLGCAGIEARNDLGRPLFDGMNPGSAGAMVRGAGLRLMGVSQIYPFNRWSDAVAHDVRALIDVADAAGAETISLIPCNDPMRTSDTDLRQAIEQITPLLEGTELLALIEPLGFAQASLRFKSEVIEVISQMGVQAHFKLVHDTFHHSICGEDMLFADATGMVHISGVSDTQTDLVALEDAHRGLVDARDRLGNIGQIETLSLAGYAGPISFECFAPEVHALENPGPAIRRSMNFITSQQQVQAA